jgi:hypothetical protein
MRLPSGKRMIEGWASYGSGGSAGLAIGYHIPTANAVYLAALRLRTQYFDQCLSFFLRKFAKKKYFFCIFVALIH